MQSNQKLLQHVLNIFRERSTYMYFEFWGLLPQERTVNLHKWKFSQRDNLPIFDEETLIGKYLAKSHMFYHSAWLFRVGKKIECSSLRSFLPQNENYFDKTKLRGTSTRSGRHTLFCYKKQDLLFNETFQCWLNSRKSCYFLKFALSLWLCNSSIWVHRFRICLWSDNLKPSAPGLWKNREKLNLNSS